VNKVPEFLKEFLRNQPKVFSRQNIFPPKYFPAKIFSRQNIFPQKRFLKFISLLMGVL